SRPARRRRGGSRRAGEGCPLGAHHRPSPFHPAALLPTSYPAPIHPHQQRSLGGLHCDRLLSRLRTDALGLCLLLCCPLLPMPIEQQTDLLRTDVGPTEPLQGSTRCAIRPRTAC